MDFLFLSTSKNGNPCSADHEINLFSAASLPMSLWACFFEVGGFMVRIASIFLGLASMPQAKTRQLSIFFFVDSKYAFF